MNDKEVDYKAMYIKLLKASEQAITTLIQAQQECEEMYIDNNVKADSQEYHSLRHCFKI